MYWCKGKEEESSRMATTSLDSSKGRSFFFFFFLFFSHSVNVHADDGECESTASTSQPDVAPGVLQDVVDTQIDNEAGPDKGFELTE